MATGRIGTTPVLQVRWSKAPSAGTTSLSGLDDNSVSLVYSVGYEAVYRNGVLLSRTNDYTATNGTTVTLIDATIAGDIIEIFANQTVPLTDTFSQTVSDGRFIKNTLTTTTGDIIYASAANTPARLAIGSTDQVLKVSGGIPAWGAAAAASFVGCMLRKTDSTQSIANGTYTAVTFDSEVLDTDGFHSNVTNNARITIPTGKGGKYLITVGLHYAQNATATRRVLVTLNGDVSTGTVICDQRTGGFSAAPSEAIWSGTYALSAGDYIQTNAYQDSGGALNIIGFPSAFCYFSASLIGA